jgi:CheY-like chemotaxis protein
VKHAIAEEREERAPTSRPMKRISGLRMRRARVLVALRDDRARYQVVTLLVRDGHDVEEVRDEHSLRARVAAGREGSALSPDLLVWDVRLAGLATLDAVGRLRGCATMPWLLFVGEVAAPDMSLGAESGPIHFCPRTDPLAVAAEARTLLVARRSEPPDSVPVSEIRRVVGQ